jgi:hypothetical protein
MEGLVSHEVTERVHLGRLSGITKNRILNAIENGFTPYWGGKARTVLEVLKQAYGLETTRYVDQWASIERHYKCEGIDDFYSEFEVMAKLLGGHTSNYIHGDRRIIHGRVPNMEHSTFIALVNKHIPVDPAIKAKCREAVEQGETIEISKSL